MNLVRTPHVQNAMSGKDVLDVPLCDAELHAEVVMTVRLMTAANESAGRLAQEEVDRLLGLRM